MAGESPVALIYDGYGQPLAVRDGYVYSPNNSGFLFAGYDDNNNIRILRTTADGYLNLQLNGATINLQPSVDQGAPNTIANAWPIKITDNTNTVEISDVLGAKALKVDVVQTTGLTETTFTTRIPTVGQKLSTNSVPVVIASDQSALTVNLGTTADLLTGTTFSSRINTLGQKTMANSTPVVLASDQAAIPVNVITDGYSTIQKTLYDVGATEIYIGKALPGTDPSSPAWLIKKTILDIDGNPVSTLWSSDTAIWDNRSIETYS